MGTLLSDGGPPCNNLDVHWLGSIMGGSFQNEIFSCFYAKWLLCIVYLLHSSTNFHYEINFIKNFHGVGSFDSLLDSSIQRSNLASLSVSMLQISRDKYHVPIKCQIF